MTSSVTNSVTSSVTNSVTLVTLSQSVCHHPSLVCLNRENKENLVSSLQCLLVQMQHFKYDLRYCCSSHARLGYAELHN